MANTKELGKAGEEAAAEYLTSLGYEILTTNFTYKGAEIDIIALDEKKNLVFCEVKTRNNPGFDPDYSVNKSKIRKLKNAANGYYFYSGTDDHECRFDLIIAKPVTQGKFEITHYINAFDY
jgi:putative endonuclease